MRARGIRPIQGDVLIDQSYYDLAPVDPAAFDRAPLRPYNAPPAALIVDFNTLGLRINPGEDGVRVNLDPPGVPVWHDVRLTSGPCSHGVAGLACGMVAGVLHVQGRFPAMRAQRLRLSVLTPD